MEQNLTREHEGSLWRRLGRRKTLPLWGKHFIQCLSDPLFHRVLPRLGPDDGGQPLKGLYNWVTESDYSILQHILYTTS